MKTQMRHRFMGPPLVLLVIFAGGCGQSIDATSLRTSAGCGQGGAGGSARQNLSVYDGDPASSTTAPFVGALFYEVGGTAGGEFGEGLCTAELICPNVVLSAAHCFYENGPATDPANASAPLSAYRFSQSLVVPFGSANDSSNWPADATPALQVVINPNWAGAGVHETSAGPDMALVQLAAPFAGPFAPLSFDPPPSTTSAGIPATVVGYGQSELSTGQDGPFGAGTQREGAATFVSSSPETLNPTGAPDPGTLVTLRGAAGQGVCPGDSGGPLLIGGTMYGVLSGIDTQGCGAQPTWPSQGASFYASVPNNAAWLKAQMAALCTPSPATTSTPTATETGEDTGTATSVATGTTSTQTATATNTATNAATNTATNTAANTATNTTSTATSSPSASGATTEVSTNPAMPQGHDADADAVPETPPCTVDN